MKTDFLVIGSGIAGLNFALRAAEFGEVLIVTKKGMLESNTNYAQGGIAAVLDSLDSFEAHERDTLKAGCDHNDLRAVKFMVRHGPPLVRELVSKGVRFQQKNEALALTLEGGHSRARIAFSGDATGHAIEQALVDRVREHPRIRVEENTVAIDLIIQKGRCYGAQVLHGRQVRNLYAKATILATGGLGQVYRYTTNPQIATGDGVAMAARAGCRLKDLEFIQFHPTALNLPRKRPFLLSEALRGEGAVLRNAQGKRFMVGVHPLNELAPRDIVARAVFQELKRGPVYLDMTHEKEGFLSQRFPTIYTQLKCYGLNLAKDLIPIAPAAHYSCGGVKVNLQGETSVKNLFAFGEVACTGVHGANRLASNSLLESLVFSHQILKALKCLTGKVKTCAASQEEYTKARTNVTRQVRQIMWGKVGIIRTGVGLTEATRQLQSLAQKLPSGINKELLEARNMVLVGRLITEAAWKRRRSLGCHYREDGLS